jgi:hypothetical protein
MATINIKTGENGTTRVFSLSMPAAQARTLSKTAEAQQAILGARDLNVEGIEVFPLTDIEDLGLVGFLREGTDARKDDLKRDAAKLAALDGWVMLVHSLAFGGKAATLKLDPAVTLIGTYAQTAPEKKHIELDPEAADLYTGAPEITPAIAPDRKGRGSLVVAVLVVIAALILWWALA